ncbi:MAG: Fe-S protein assembly co-chaperone HscB [Rhizobacter sp.]|nr:Fe-S protein assembly co-chaperone HscB [Rhizobacter sp.]
MNIASDDFELFGLPRRFEQDRSDIDTRWRTLQGEVHPDRFAGQGASAQRLAMQWAVRVNEAYQRLKDPLRRAAYLCELNGAPIEAENNTAMPTEFLMQQMEWREALDDAKDVAAVEALQREVLLARNEQLSRLHWTIDERADYAAASQQVRALMFVERFAEDIDRRMEALGQ